MSKIHLSTYHEGDYAEYRIPGIICTSENTLLAYCEGRSGETDWGRIEILLWRSEAPAAGKPRAWSGPSVLVPSRNGQTVNNANMIADGDRIHLLYHTDYQNAFYCRSTDDGRTWSEPKEITAAFDEFRERREWFVCASGPSHGIAMRSGRLIMPIWIGGSADDPQAHCPACPGILYSDDRGETWHAGGLILDDAVPNSSESVVAELSDGRLMINIRNDDPAGLRAAAVSADGGESFGPVFLDPQLPDPQCSAGMTAADGALYFTNCAVSGDPEDSRVNLTLKRSRDDGKTWEIVTPIEEKAGYSDVCADRDGNLFCFYECGRPAGHNGSFPQLHLTVFGREKEG